MGGNKFVKKFAKKSNDKINKLKKQIFKNPAKKADLEKKI